MVKISGHAVAVALLAFTTTVDAQNKKGSTSPPPTATVTEVAPAAAFGGGFDIGALLAKQIKVQQAELKELIAKHGKDSNEVRKALQSLREIEHFAKRHSQNNPPAAGVDAATLAPPALAPVTTIDASALAPTIDASALAPPTAAPSIAPAGTEAATLAPPLTISRSRAEMARILHAAAQGGGAENGLDRGEADPRRTAMEGLEFELRSLAAEIQNAPDEAVKNAKSVELREIAETVVVLRSRYRERAIKQLEERLAALKAEQKGDSVDALIGRLVPQSEKPAADEPKKDKKEKKERDNK